MNYKEWCNLVDSLEPKKATDLDYIFLELANDTELTELQKERLVEKTETILLSFEGYEDNPNKKEVKEKFVDYSELGLDYEDYTGLFDDFSISTKSWQELNPSGLPYQQWLIQVGLPTFWQQPRPELQHPLLTVCSFINSAVIPSWTAKARKEAQLPLIVFSGESRSGKTEGCKFIFGSYHPSRTLLIKADSTGASLRDSIDNICWNPHKECYLPSTVLIDNFEHQFLQKWDSFKVLLLSVLRSQSTARLKGFRGVMEEKHCHTLKLFTTVESVKAFNGKQSEFYNRQVFFFTKRTEDVKSIGNYSFSDIPDYYKEIWSSENVKSRWFSILGEFLRLDDNATVVPPLRWAQSVIIMATGVYIGIWKDVIEASEFTAEYWKWVNEQEGNHRQELDLLVNDFLDDFYDNTVFGVALGKRHKCHFKQDELLSYIRKRSSFGMNQIRDFVHGYLAMKKYRQDTDSKIGNKGGEVVWFYPKED
jgi:hypothetical protein